MSSDLPAVASWKRNTPNALTSARVVLAAGVVVILSAALHPPTLADGMTPDRGWLLLAAGVFVIAALTDALDGYLARRWHVVSLFGRVVDPFADKLLVLGSFVCLAGATFADPRGGMASGVDAWMAVLILARELLVTTLRGVYESRGVDFSATWSGKSKMILQSIVIPTVLVILALSPAEPGSPARWAIGSLVWVTVIVTAWSGVPYLMRAWKASKEQRG